MKWLKVYAVLAFVVASTWSSLSQADTQFRIIVDASGSMQTSDPDRITSEAIRLISNLAPEGKATLGVWLFGEQPRVLFPESVINAGSKVKLTNYVNSYVTQDLKTDFESILDLLLKTPDVGGLKPGFKRDWILVTDGNVDISLDEKVNQASRQRIWTDITKKLEEKGIRLHTISLTNYSDKALLDHLSFRTDASRTELAVPEDMLDAFDRIFSQSMPYQELPLQGDRFKVDPSVDQITIESLHEGGGLPTLTQPDGQPFALSNRDGVSVTEAPHFTVATITDPMPGTWQVSGVDLSRVKIRAISSLSLRATSIDSFNFVNEPIESTVSLFRDDQALKGPDTPKGNVEQTLKRIMGDSKEVVFKTNLDPLKDRFKNRIEGISKPGEYELSTEYLGSVDRKFEQYFTVQPPISFSAQSSSDSLVTFSSSATNGKLDFAHSNLKLELIFADGSKQLTEMANMQNGDWDKVVPVSPNEEIKARAHLVGVTREGASINYWTPTWTIHRKGSDPVYVEKGNISASAPEPTATVSIGSEQDVAPVSITPNVDIVNDGQTAEQTPQNQDQSETDKLLADVKGEAEDTFGIDSLLLYFAIGAGVVILLAVVLIAVRRSRRPSGRYDDLQDDDVDDV